MYRRSYLSPLGMMTMAGEGDSLLSLSFDGERCFHDELPVFDETVRWLDEYFSGLVPDFTPCIRLDGTPFRRRVWERLLEIPYGATVSYGDIAHDLGIRSAQAVGGAVGNNPVAIIVPCHRVIGSDGTLVGYHGGIDRKIGLLRLEGILLC